MYDEQVRMNRVKDKQSQRRTKVGKKTHMDKTLHPKFYMVNNMVISVYLSSLSVAHFSDAPRRRLVVTGDSARIQDETTESSAWFFNVLGVQHRHTGPRFIVSSERHLIIVNLTSRELNPQPRVFKSSVLTAGLCGPVGGQNPKLSIFVNGRNPTLPIFESGQNPTVTYYIFDTVC